MQWLEANRDIWWDLLRVYLGFALVVKGIVYMTHRTSFAEQMSTAQVPFASTGLAELVALTHIAGGLMLAFGLLTRVGAAIQIPNLLGAVLFVHLKDGLFTPGQTLEFALLVLFALVLYAISGAGRLSIDYAFSAQRERAIELERASEAPPAERHEPATAHG
jgi:uncharacterized membrane protein YphA (DoxX/SURF4 family)